MAHSLRTLVGNAREGGGDVGRSGKGRPKQAVVEGLAGLVEVGDVLSQAAYRRDETLVASAMLARAVQEYGAWWDDESYLYSESDDSLEAKICDWEKELARSGVSDAPMTLATLVRDCKLHRKIAAYDAVAVADKALVISRHLFETRALEKLGDPSLV